MLILTIGHGYLQPRSGQSIITSLVISIQFQVPFSNETRDLVLEKLSDMNFVQDICDDLHALFEVGTHDLYPDPLSICLIQLKLFCLIVLDFRRTKASTG